MFLLRPFDAFFSLFIVCWRNSIFPSINWRATCHSLRRCCHRCMQHATCLNLGRFAFCVLLECCKRFAAHPYVSPFKLFFVYIAFFVFALHFLFSTFSIFPINVLTAHSWLFSCCRRIRVARWRVASYKVAICKVFALLNIAYSNFPSFFSTNFCCFCCCNKLCNVCLPGEYAALRFTCRRQKSISGAELKTFA